MKKFEVDLLSQTIHSPYFRQTENTNRGIYKWEIVKHDTDLVIFLLKLKNRDGISALKTGTKQTIVIDVRGQKCTSAILEKIISK